MRLVAFVLIGLVLGFFAGIVISEVIGIFGVLLFQRAVGIRYLPLYLAAAFAIGAPVADRWLRSRRGARGSTSQG